MKKTILTACVAVCLAAGTAGGAQTSAYEFVTNQSTVLQTGGYVGISIPHRITGRFQMTVNPDGATAEFDWVDARLGASPYLYTRSLEELFYMTGLKGTVIDDKTIEFVSPALDPSGPLPYGEIRITLTFENGSVRLEGGYCEPVSDGYCYEINAVAAAESVGWTYHYYDDFTTRKAKEDSYTHSVFWPMEAFPPPEPYLYYYSPGGNQGLVFADFEGQPAHLGYCFPLGPSHGLRAVRGTLEVDVRFPSNAYISQSPPGYLLCSTSADGVIWSTPEPMEAGHNGITLNSVQGTCYVIFLGTRVMIDDLEVHLFSSPATIHVPADFGTIQEAIDASADGDIVEVAPGVYTGPGNWDIEFGGKAITVRSAEGPEQTIIDCADTGMPGGGGPGGRAHRGFYLHQAEKSDSVVRGFTIRGGRIPGSEIPPDNMRWNLNPTHPVGAGIYCEYSSPTIIDCVVRDCRTEVGGGIGSVGGEPTIIGCLVEECTAGGVGVADSGGRGGGIGLIRGSNAEIRDCIVRNNKGYHNSYGAGLYCRGADVMLKNCHVAFNGPETEGSPVDGGGIYCGREAEVSAMNCLIYGNIARMGAGVLSERKNAITEPDAGEIPRNVLRVTNCTVAHNRLSGPQMPPFPGGGIHSIGSDIIVENSIVWHNEGTAVFIVDAPSKSPVVYSDIEGGYLGQGNIDKQPLFAPVAVPDYHLQSIYGRYSPQTGEWVIDQQHSPCIDAGDPKDPVGHEPWPNGGRINMGAYGGTRQASKGVSRLVYHVDGEDGDDSNSGLSRSRAFATIQRGIDASRDGDVVVVWPAVYEEEVSFDGKAVTVQSAADAAVVVATSGYAFSFFNAEGPDSVLRNFVIRSSEYGIFCSGASPTISNLTIVKNEYGIAGYGGADPNISNCILWENNSGDLFQCRTRYSCVQNPPLQIEGEGNITDDPLFADSNNGDFHLLSREGRYWSEHSVWVIDDVTSPCVDAGEPDVYPRRERMPNGGRLNMGAYGGTAYASMSKWPLRGDMNMDGLINMRDLAILADGWLDSLPWAPRELMAITDIIGPLDGSVIPVPR